MLKANRYPSWMLMLLLSTCFMASFVVQCRKHHLGLENDERRLIHITTFGFYKGGSLEVNLDKFYINPPVTGDQSVEKVGFTVDRTLNDGINPYSHNMEDSCSKDFDLNDDSFSSIRFVMDFKNNIIKVQCSAALQPNVKICKSTACVAKRPWTGRTEVTNLMTQRQKRNGTSEVDKLYDDSSVELDPEFGTVSDEDFNGKNAEESLFKIPKPAVSEVDEVKTVPVTPSPKPLTTVAPVVVVSQASSSSSVAAATVVGNNCNEQQIPLNATKLSDGTISYSLTFVVYIAGEDCEGLYNLYFHNCARGSDSRVTLDMSIVEENQDSEGKNYLSAGEMPLPALYFMMSVLFFTAGCFWVVILKKSRRETGVSVFKIHYLMMALVFVKSLSLLFHSINFHYIQIFGTHVEGWAILYYITHLLKGALLFLTILLIGTGYAFVKHLLSDKEKKLFMIVIPLQVLANVAQIIMEESEEGEVVHTTWKVIFISVDLLCCGAILFPVVWSIRHLQEAAETDGKAAANLRKLKLFRHFYIMVVCYIYFTRIIVQMLLRITVPFQYEWLDDMFREMTTFIFFVLTGYKFRPTANNPYLELAHGSDEEADMDTAITESGFTEGLSKRGYKPKKRTLKEIVLFDPNEDGSDDDEEVLLEKREASHDFD